MEMESQIHWMVVLWTQIKLLQVCVDVESKIVTQMAMGLRTALTLAQLFLELVLVAARLVHNLLLTSKKY